MLLTMKMEDTIGLAAPTYTEPTKDDEPVKQQAAKEENPDPEPQAQAAKKPDPQPQAGPAPADEPQPQADPDPQAADDPQRTSADVDQA